MATKKEIAEMVLFKLNGGWPDVNFQVDERDIFDALEHKVNELFKIHQFDTTLPNGETIPENTMIATYENVAVTSFGEVSKSVLPVTPISLPKNVGIFLIYDPAFPDTPFIPLQRGMRGLLKTDTLLSDTMGLVSYEPKNNTVIYSKDLTTLGVTAVTMELCVFEISNYSITQDLPIPADYVGRIEDELVKEFAPVTPENGLVNNFTTAGQHQPAKQ